LRKECFVINDLGGRCRLLFVLPRYSPYEIGLLHETDNFAVNSILSSYNRR